MKGKNFVWIIGIASVLFWACEKESHLQPAQRPAMPDEISAWLTPGQVQQFEDDYALALQQFSHEAKVLPIFVQMNVSVSRNAIVRAEIPGDDGVDIRILGNGEWADGDAAKYFEAIYGQDPKVFQGEGWLQKSAPGSAQNSMLYFTSEPWDESIYGLSTDEYRMDATLRIFRGTGEFRYSSGKVVRHILFEEGDYVNGIAIIYGHVVVPGMLEAHEEPTYVP